MTMRTGLTGLQETLTNKWSTQETLDKYRLVVWEVASSSQNQGLQSPGPRPGAPLQPREFQGGARVGVQVARPRRLHAPAGAWHCKV